jgi:hypothetical protein
MVRHAMNLTQPSASQNPRQCHPDQAIEGRAPPPDGPLGHPRFASGTAETACLGNCRNDFERAAFGRPRVERHRRRGVRWQSTSHRQDRVLARRLWRTAHRGSAFPCPLPRSIARPLSQNNPDQGSCYALCTQRHSCGNHRQHSVDVLMTSAASCELAWLCIPRLSGPS